MSTGNPRALYEKAWEEARKVFPERLRGLRGDRSQQDFAELVGTDQQTLSRWESGKAFPRLVTLITISRVTGESLDYLTGISNATHLVGASMAPDIDDCVMANVYLIRTVADLKEIEAGGESVSADMKAPMSRPHMRRWGLGDDEVGAVIFAHVLSNSMAPAMVCGGIAMLDLRVESRSFASGAFLCGKVFLVRVGDSGEATFRRAFYDPGARTLLLVADSPHWKPVSIYVSSPEHLQHTLLARVVWCGNPML